VAAVDLFGERGRPAAEPPPALGRALRLYAASHEDQLRLPSQLPSEVAPDAVVVARVTSVRDAEAVAVMISEGLQVVAPLPCSTLRRCSSWPGSVPLLGEMSPQDSRCETSRRPTDAAVVDMRWPVLAVYQDAGEAVRQLHADRVPEAQLRRWEPSGGKDEGHKAGVHL
jgi:hypothetical protein